MDRRKLLLRAELCLALVSLALVGNAMLPHPSLAACFVLAAIASGVSGFHRPALEALTPRLVERDELRAVSALSSIRGNVAAIGGPALGGLCLAILGLPGT
jgi:MFS family permease